MAVDAQVEAVIVGQGAGVDGRVYGDGAAIGVGAAGAGDGGVRPAAGIGPFAAQRPFLRDFVIADQGGADRLVIFETEAFACEVVTPFGAR